jgi:hypothetical protein
MPPAALFPGGTSVVPSEDFPPPGGDAAIPPWYEAIPGLCAHRPSLLQGCTRAARLRSRPDTRRSQGCAVTIHPQCGVAAGLRAQHPSPSSCPQTRGWCHPFPLLPLYPGGNGPIPPWSRRRPLGGPAASLPIAEAILRKGERRTGVGSSSARRGSSRTSPGRV